MTDTSFPDDQPAFDGGDEAPDPAEAYAESDTQSDGLPDNVGFDPVTGGAVYPDAEPSVDAESAGRVEGDVDDEPVYDENYQEVGATDDTPNPRYSIGEDEPVPSGVENGMVLRIHPDPTDRGRPVFDEFLTGLHLRQYVGNIAKGSPEADAVREAWERTVPAVIDALDAAAEAFADAEQAAYDALADVR